MEKRKAANRFRRRRTLRLTVEEDERLTRQAVTAGISISEYMRRLYRGFDIEEAHKIVAEIEHKQGWASQMNARSGAGQSHLPGGMAGVSEGATEAGRRKTPQ